MGQDVAITLTARETDEKGRVWMTRKEARRLRRMLADLLELSQ